MPAPAHRTTRDTGLRVEAAARRYLVAQGLAPVTENFRSRFGELDLVMLDGATLVIVEVRYRADARFGGGAASVHAGKQRRLVAATGWLLARRPALAERRVRFDVIAAHGPLEALQFDWLRDAFRA